MKGTTWVQIIKACLLVAGAGAMTVWVLARYGFNLSDLLGAAVAAPGSAGEALLGPGAQYGATGTSQLNFLSLSLALVLGTAGLPHVLMRFYTVPTSKEAPPQRRVGHLDHRILLPVHLVLGYGAGALVGKEAILAAPGKVNSAAPLLAYELGGTILLGVIAAVAFATILAVVAGLAITASASFAHDVYALGHQAGEVEPGAEVRVARITVVVIGAVAIVGGIFAQRPERGVPRGARLRRGRQREPADDPLLAVLAAVHHPRGPVEHVRRADLLPRPHRLLPRRVREGRPGHGASLSMIRNTSVDFSWFPLENPGLVTIPLAFFLGWLGSVTGRERGNERRAARDGGAQLTGAGAEKAVEH